MVVAVVLGVPLASALATGSTDSGAGSSSGSTGVTIDKAATPLDGDQTTVTLEVGAQEKNTAADVVFVLDKSTSLGVKDEALSMLSDLWAQVQEKGIEVKVGVVTFNNNVNNSEANMPLTTLNESTLKSVKDVFSASLSSGTNIEAGIRAGMNLLDTDSTVLDSNKHLVLVTDGVSYLWGTDAPQTVYNEFRHHDGSDLIWSSNSIASGLTDKSALKIANQDYVNSFSNPKQWMSDNNAIENFADTYQMDWNNGTYDANLGEYVSKDITNTYCSNDVALYMAGKAWQDASSRGYNLYSFVSDKYNAENGVLNSEGYYPWAANFFGNLSKIGGISKEYHEGEGASYSGMFDGVKNTVLYEIQNGTVIDIIGEDFNLTSLSSFKLTVGGETLDAKVILAENKVLFGDNFADNRYVVTYHPAEEDVDEYFTWEINVPVEQGQGLKLSYDLTLVNWKTEPGEYEVPTNKKAVLEYTPTVGDEGEDKFPVPWVKYSVAKPGEDVGNDGVVVDKDANPKDLTNTDETTVSLSIGSTQETTAADVVFVLDKSTSNEVKKEALAMLKELMEHTEKNNLVVNVGVVTFNKTANNDEFNLGLTELDQDSYNKIADIFGKELESGTNLEAGIRAGMNMLDDDTDVLAENKHLVLVSDGVTYMWGTGDTPQTVYVELSYGNAAASVDYVKNDYDYRDKDYSKFLNAAQWLENAKTDGIDELITEYGTDYTEGYGKVDTYIPASERSPYTSLETAMYKGGRAWQEAAEKSYQLYAFAAEDYVTSGAYPWGPNFIKGLSTIGGVSAFYTDDATGVEDMFDGVKNDVLYEIEKGTVTDIIGKDFDLSDKGAIDVSTFKLTVGDVEQKASVDAEDSNKVNFGVPSNDVYPYSVTYSIDENGDEILIWDINVPVEASKGLELSYNLTLVNRSLEPGKHENIPTNESATLKYESTDGTKGEKPFPVPEVWYEVKEVTVWPADMTIYMGGDDGYDSVVAGSGDTTVGTASDSLPEPGFYIQLDDELNKLIDEENPGAVAATDLSKMITFKQANDSSGRTWKFEKYGTENGSSEAYDKFVYRLVPAVEGQDPVRLEFTNADGSQHFTSDNFDPGTDAVNHLSNEYKMGIYAGGADLSSIVMEIEIGNKTYTRAVEVDTGTLTVRYVVDNDNNNNPVTEVRDEFDPTKEKDAGAVAVIDNTAKYYVNESDIVKANNVKASLLFDGIVTDETGNEDAKAFDSALLTKAESVASLKSTGHESKYLNLVDANNGNAWLTTDKAVTVYWPYPDGMTEEEIASAEFSLVHFVGLDRGDVSNDDIVETIKDIPVAEGAAGGTDMVARNIKVDKTDHGVTFTLEPEKYQVKVSDGDTIDVKRVRFSPFVLMWTAATEPDPGPGPQPTTGSLTVKKAITGDLADEGDEFTFTVTLSGTSAAEGNKTYGNVKFTDGVATITLKGGESKTMSGIPGGTKYTVEETNANGYKLADSSGTTGTISAGTTKTASFTNDKSTADTPEPVAARFVARKVLNGAELKAGQFTFELRDADGKVVATATNDASGTIVFDGLTFDEEGTYEFTISEVNGGSEDYTYDASVKGCYVVVTEEDGKLVAEAFAHDDLVFTNEYVGTEDPGEPDEPDTPDTPDTPDEPGEPTTPVTPGEDVPDTGDHTNGVLPAVLALGGVALVSGALVVARRRAM